MVDEEGKLCFMVCLAIGALVGAIVGFGTSLVSEAISNDKFSKVNWVIVASSTIFGAKKMTGIYKTSKDYLKTLVSPKKIAMYQGKIKGVYKTIAKKVQFMQ